MRRSPNFLIYPGTGYWMLFERNRPGTSFDLVPHLDIDTIRAITERNITKLLWVDQGAGADTLMRLRRGGASSSATEITTALLEKYEKEKKLDAERRGE